MGVKTFIYCDYCNPNAIRVVDRRPPERASVGGRRNSDSRSFIDGGNGEAAAAGWTIVRGMHFCPRCGQHADRFLSREGDPADSESASGQQKKSRGLLDKLFSTRRSSK